MDELIKKRVYPLRIGRHGRSAVDRLSITGLEYRVYETEDEITSHMFSVIHESVQEGFSLTALSEINGINTLEGEPWTNS